MFSAGCRVASRACWITFQVLWIISLGFQEAHHFLVVLLPLLAIRMQVL
jgi:hypothetical protein